MYSQILKTEVGNRKKGKKGKIAPGELIRMKSTSCLEIEGLGTQQQCARARQGVTGDHINQRAGVFGRRKATVPKKFSQRTKPMEHLRWSIMFHRKAMPSAEITIPLS